MPMPMSHTLCNEEETRVRAFYTCAANTSKSESQVRFDRRSVLSLQLPCGDGLSVRDTKIS